MKQPLISACVLVVLAGCPEPTQNPERLWLALDGSETRVRLVGEEPRPF